MSETTAAVDTVTLTIDGVEISVPKGTLLIRAAEAIGVQVPRFCDHPLLDPLGACRQCIVDVEGQRKPLTACTTTVADGMVVRTQMTSEMARQAQEGTLELLLINHPLDCPTCDKGGECPLQNQTLTNGPGESRFVDRKRLFPKPLAISSQVLLDRERCVLCARCTRFSAQIAGDPFIELFERGALEQVAVYEDEPFESYFSGNTVQICPVGALTGASYRFRARPFDLRSTTTACEHCASGCALRVDARRNTVLRRLAGSDPEVNEEWNCDKGRWAFTYSAMPDRLTTPLVRDSDGSLREASWSEALERAAGGLRAARSSAVLTGGRLTLEDSYAYSKLARVVLGTNNVDFRTRASSPEEDTFLGLLAGTGVQTTYADVEAAPAVLLVDLEPEDESPILFLRLRKAARRHGQQVFTIAPSVTAGSRKVWATPLLTAPGGQADVLRAIAAGGEGATAAAGTALRAEGSLILVGERAAATPGALGAVCALADATGAHVAWVPRRAGDRGALDAGALPAVLPGGRPVSDAAAVAELAAHWGVESLPGSAGLNVVDALAAAGSGALDALVVAGVDVDDLPDPAAARVALDAVPFLVSLELRTSAITDLAHVVLPVAAVVEKAGTFVDWEGRPTSFDAALAQVGLSLPEWKVLASLAREMGVDFGWRDVHDVRRELAELGHWEGSKPGLPAPGAVEPVVAGEGEAVLATWPWLLDAGRMQDGEENLAGTARRARATVSAATAEALGLTGAAEVTVSTDRGAITVPLEIGDVAEGVVVLPAASRGCLVRRDLADGSGALVRVAPAEQPAAGTDEAGTDALQEASA